MIRPGAQFDRYVVEAEIGRGGMAIVYRVRHQSLGSLHALKVLFLPSPSLHERVVLEGRMQASFRHPNVVAVTDVIDVDGAYGLIMDLVDGVPLETWLEARRPTLQEQLRLFRQIVAGVRAAHVNGIVHRDLKPGNVLVAPRDAECVPLITDFGLAKTLGSIGPTVTRTNVSMGTPAYMAPEQIRDAKNVDARADLFSLGAVLYRMVCGRPAFDGEDVLSILYATTSGRYTRPSVLRPDLPDAVVRAIEGCLVPRKEDRIPSCDALLATLDGAIVDHADTAPITADPAQRSLPTLTPRENSQDERPITREEMDAAALEGAEAGTTDQDSAPAPSIWPSDDEELEEKPPSRLLSRHRITILAALGMAALALLVTLYRAPEGVEQPSTVTSPPSTSMSVSQPAAPAPVAPAPVAPAPGAPEVVTPPPEVATQPEEPVAAAAPSPEKAAAPKSVSPPMGRVTVLGDATKVWLEADGAERLVSGSLSLPPGTYQIVASFPDAERVPAGTLDLKARAYLQLSCQAAFLRCRVLP